MMGLVTNGLYRQDCELRMPGNSALEEIDLHRPVNEFLKLIQTERPHLWKAPPSGNYAQRVRLIITCTSNLTDNCSGVSEMSS
jgi:hypothetical protein